MYLCHAQVANLRHFFLILHLNKMQNTKQCENERFRCLQKKVTYIVLKPYMNLSASTELIYMKQIVSYPKRNTIFKTCNVVDNFAHHKLPSKLHSLQTKLHPKKKSCAEFFAWCWMAYFVFKPYQLGILWMCLRQFYSYKLRKVNLSITSRIRT